MQVASGRWRRAIDDEADELAQLARRLSAQSGADSFISLTTRRLRALAQTATPYEAECALESLARDLRAAWLNLACNAANQSYRSPTCEPFGFRSHRFDVVTPEGEAPYLRIAMGRRDGWSCEQITPVVLEAARRLNDAAQRRATPRRKRQFMSGVSTPNHFSLT